MESRSPERFRSKPIAVVGWLLAGAPIVASGTQSAARLAGTPVEFWPVIGGLAATVKQVPAFQRMALAFDPSSPLVLGLFLLVVAAWVTLGLSLFRPTKLFEDYAREVRGGGLLASTVLYGLLFLGAYWPVATSGAGLGVWTALVGLLVSVEGGIYVAAKTQPRTNGNRLLNEARRRVDELERELDQVVDDIEADLSRLDPDIEIEVQRLDEVRQRRTQLSNVDSEITEARDLPENQREISARELITDEIEPLETDPASSVVGQAVRSELADWLAETYDTVEVSSQFGESYTLENHDQYRRIDLRGADLSDSIPITDIGSLTEEIDAKQVDIGDTVRAVNTVDTHVNRLRSDLSERAASFAELVSETESELEEAFDRIDKLPPDVREYVSGAYRSGAVDGVDHAGIVKSQAGPDRDPGDLDRAMELHHDCRFKRAEELAQEAATEAEQLRRAVGFVRRVALSTDDGLPGVDTPEWSTRGNPFFTEELIGRGVNARLDGVRLDPDWTAGRIEFQYGAGGDPESDTGSDGDSDRETPDYLIQDGVRWLFNALRREDIGEVRERQMAAVNGESAVRVQINDDEIPRSIADPEVMKLAAEHVDSQDAFDAEVEYDNLPGIITFDIDVDGDVPPSKATIGEQLLNSFEN